MKGLPNVGDVLAGKYKVDRILGIGGMGMVVAATHLELENQVAIKLMLPAALESREASDRFLREARAASRLTSEHVCRVTDVGKFDGGVPYIVMEYLEGYDLGTLLKRKGPLKVEAAVDFILQACEGMAEAHGHGIVHRDLKPDNLFLHARSDGTQVVKVLDFGISKATVTGIATKTGDIMGSPAYMAPEQMQSSKDVDQRADVWSLGVILYQLISGRLPFIADTLPALCLAVLNEPPPSLETIRRDLPHGLAQVAMKCLAKQRDERYRNVHELAQALVPYGKPESAAAITRIRSMLQRKRPPTPPPLMMLPSEFSDLAPTLVGDEDGAKPAAAEPAETVTDMPIAATTTTMGSSSGESMSVAGAVTGSLKRANRGLVGALVGAIALVGLIIVMVLVRRDSSPSAAAAQPPSVPAQPATGGPVVEPLPPEPKIETPPPAPEPGLDTPPVVADDTREGTGSGSDAKKRRRKKDGAGSGSSASAGSADAGSGAGSTAGQVGEGSAADADDDDKWGRMHHDGKKDE